MMHYHIWSRSMDGTEFGNVVIENLSDASVTYYNMTRNMIDPANELSIEDVIGPLQEGNAVYSGRPGFIMLLAGCDGLCFSSTWN